MEVRDQRGVQHICRRDPGLLLRPVTLPIHQILKATQTPSGLEQSPYGVHRSVIQQQRRRRSRSRERSMDGHASTTNHRFEQGDMKRGRDAVLRGELQTVGHRIDLTEDLEGTDVPRAELATR